MSNTFFEFKQFRIGQDRCAMKVTTDACILGAYSPAPDAGTILDIGSGTGLLALMLAQRAHAMIDAVELDASAFSQLRENIESSKWKSRIQAIHTDIKSYAPHTKYDFIICNPPFFSNQLQSPTTEKNRARHDVSLDDNVLLHSVQRLLAPRGKFSVLIPYDRLNDFTRKAKLHQLQLSKQLLIRARPEKPFIRVILIFKNEEVIKTETEILSVKSESGEYSDFFGHLLRDFYLYL
jgi:tRNA1Val (adenine37-N6)-methyltransferase